MITDYEKVNRKSSHFPKSSEKDSLLEGNLQQVERTAIKHHFKIELVDEDIQIKDYTPDVQQPRKTAMSSVPSPNVVLVSFL